MAGLYNEVESKHLKARSVSKLESLVNIKYKVNIFLFVYILLYIFLKIKDSQFKKV